MNKGVSLFLLLLLSFSINAANFTDWKVVYENDKDSFLHCDFRNQFNGIAVGKHGLFMITRDGGDSWIDRSDAQLGNITHIDWIYDDLILVTNGHQAFRSLDTGKTWTKTFDRSDVEILGIQKIALPDYDTTLFLNCKKSVIFQSHSHGVKWYQKDTRDLFRFDEDILLCYGGVIPEGYTDTLYELATNKHSFIQTEDDFRSYRLKENHAGNSEVSAVVDQYDFSKYWFLAAKVFINDEGKVFLSSDSRPLIDKDLPIKSCIWIHRYVYNPIGDYFGWAVGDEGLILEYIQEDWPAYVEILSPTTKNLKYIDFAANDDDIQENHRFSKNGTSIIVGDGVILQKKMDWISVSTPNLKNTRTQVYPNPIQDESLLISEEWPKNEIVKIRLHSTSGYIIDEFDQPVSYNGKLLLNLNGRIPKGVYILELSNGSRRDIKRIVKN